MTQPFAHLGIQIFTDPYMPGPTQIKHASKGPYWKRREKRLARDPKNWKHEAEAWKTEDPADDIIDIIFPLDTLQWEGGITGDPDSFTVKVPIDTRDWVCSYGTNV